MVVGNEKLIMGDYIGKICGLFLDISLKFVVGDRGRSRKASGYTYLFLGQDSNTVPREYEIDALQVVTV